MVKTGVIHVILLECELQNYPLFTLSRQQLVPERDHQYNYLICAAINFTLLEEILSNDVILFVKLKSSTHNLFCPQSSSRPGVCDRAYAASFLP